MRFHPFFGLVAGVLLLGLVVFFPRFEAPADEALAVRILVAKSDLAAGHWLEPEDVRWQDWPNDLLPPDVFRNAAQLFDPDGMQRPVLNRALQAGEPIVSSMIGNDARRDQLTGWRAVSIRIDAISGVSGFVTPGDRVDVLLTRQVNRRLTSTVILKDVQVLAIDLLPPFGEPQPAGHTLLLAVEAVGAQKLILAQQVGRLSVTLRGTQPQDIRIDRLENDLGLPPPLGNRHDRLWYGDFPIPPWMRPDAGPPHPPRGYIP